MMGNLKFTLGSRLGSGGRGDVYLGYVREMNRWVAVKYLREFHIPQQKQAFFREIDMLRKQIPGMVRLLDFNKLANFPKTGCCLLQWDWPMYSPIFIRNAAPTATINSTTSWQPKMAS